ncbi:MAG: sugar-binding transcriptional regulator [Chloroflexi bacterium]|nr:sugar-binding transcriptional regulator [Chloroflexota bacterium]
MNAILLEKVAKLYYEDGMTQEKIAQKMRISRPKVSRLLTEARAEGVVQIIVSSLPNGFEDLERELEVKAGLLDSVVVRVSRPDDSMMVSQELGAAAAQYFERIVQDGDVVGFTWGNTLSVMADQISPIKLRQMLIVQMVGGMGDPFSDAHAGDIARRVAQTLNAKLAVMPAPGIVDTVEMCDAMRKNKHVSSALSLGAEVKLAFVGIGSFRKDALLMRNEDIISWQEVDPLIKRGAVGDIGLRFFDIQGRRLLSEIDQRIIGVELDVIRKLDRVVGVAGGTQKYDAILGAVRGKYINSLVTDEETARRLVLDLA